MLCGVPAQSRVGMPACVAWLLWLLLLLTRHTAALEPLSTRVQRQIVELRCGYLFLMLINIIVMVFIRRGCKGIVKCILCRMTAKPKPRDKRNPVATAIGRRVKDCRIEAELSQEELADAALLDRTRISAIERGVANPTVETLAVICNVLGLTLSDLFEPLKLSLTPEGERQPEVEPEPKRRRLR